MSTARVDTGTLGNPFPRLTDHVPVKAKSFPASGAPLLRKRGHVAVKVYPDVGRVIRCKSFRNLSAAGAGGFFLA